MSSVKSKAASKGISKVSNDLLNKEVSNEVVLDNSRSTANLNNNIVRPKVPLGIIIISVLTAFFAVFPLIEIIWDSNKSNNGGIFLILVFPFVLVFYLFVIFVAFFLYSRLKIARIVFLIGFIIWFVSSLKFSFPIYETLKYILGYNFHAFSVVSRLIFLLAAMTYIAFNKNAKAFLSEKFTK